MKLATQAASSLRTAAATSTTATSAETPSVFPSELTRLRPLLGSKNRLGGKHGVNPGGESRSLQLGNLLNFAIYLSLGRAVGAQQLTQFNPPQLQIRPVPHGGLAGLDPQLVELLGLPVGQPQFFMQARIPEPTAAPAATGAASKTP